MDASALAEHPVTKQLTEQGWHVWCSPCLALVYAKCGSFVARAGTIEKLPEAIDREQAGRIQAAAHCEDVLREHGDPWAGARMPLLSLV